jgi:hypothetical protein
MMICQSEKNPRSLFKECFWISAGAVTIAWIFWQLWKLVIAADAWLRADGSNFIVY